MDNDIIQCPRCETDNPVASDICYVCGEPLHAEQSDKSRNHWLIGVLLLITTGIGAFFVYNHISGDSDPPIASKKASSSPQALSTENKAGPVAPESVPAASKTEAPAVEFRKKEFTTGVVIIKNVAEKKIIQLPAAIVADGWVALPRQACLGGSQWLFQTANGQELSITEGIIAEDDLLGIWRINNSGESLGGHDLQPWAEGKALMWASLTVGAAGRPVKIIPGDRQTHFAKATLTPAINEHGILLQDDHLVGWTFGNALEGAYVWIGSSGTELKAELRVEDYYRTTFANSREEELTLALSLGDNYTQIERLAAVANAFRFEPKLSVQNTPDNLKPTTVIPRLRTMTAQAVQEGYALDVAAVFDAQILVQIADIDLVAEVLSATVEGYDFEEAAELAEDIRLRVPWSDDRSRNQFAELRSGLYQNWITLALDQGDIADGRHAYELGRQRLPEDLKIHLLGVRLALAENDWNTAEGILAQKDYPASMADQVRILQSRISELKGQEGKIVIRFTPGSQIIQVKATLGESVEQRFIVDTGASTVTIPSATAELLGIDVDGDYPVRRVTTAAGIIEAPEVVVSSLKLENWEVADINALVIDIPNQTDLGLLGLNFLERFRMDLNTEKGILILEPR